MTSNPPPLGNNGQNNGASHDWPPLHDIKPKLPLVPFYRFDAFPPIAKEVIEWLNGTGTSSLQLAGHACLGAMSLLAQRDFNVETRNPLKPSPISLSLYHESPSGNRKSTVYSSVFEGHEDADKTAYHSWITTKRVYDSYMAQDATHKANHPAPSQPAERAPIRMFNDVTAESIQRLFRSSGYSIGLINPEAAVQVQNWSGSQGRAGRTMSTLNSLWSGESISTVRVANGGIVEVEYGGRATIAWAIQPEHSSEFVFTSLSEAGFMARLLYSRDIDVPIPAIPNVKQHHLVYNSPSLQQKMKDFNDIVRDRRQVQDYGIEYLKPPSLRNRVTITRSVAAIALIDLFAQDQLALQRVALDDGNSLMQSVYVRGPEMACRIAAVFAAWDWYVGHPNTAVDHANTKVVISDKVMADAIELTIWYQGETKQQAESSNYTDLAEAAQGLRDVIQQEYQRNPSKYIDAGKYLLLNTLANNAGPTKGARGNVRKDPKFRQEVIQLLVDEIMVQPAPEQGRGKYQVHPELR